MNADRRRYLSELNKALKYEVLDPRRLKRRHKYAKKLVRYISRAIHGA
jgi:hypothetical protein